jgi:hypothetical protein
MLLVRQPSEGRGGTGAAPTDPLPPTPHHQSGLLHVPTELPTQAGPLGPHARRGGDQETRPHAPVRGCAGQGQGGWL